MTDTSQDTHAPDAARRTAATATQSPKFKLAHVKRSDLVLPALTGVALLSIVTSGATPYWIVRYAVCLGLIGWGMPRLVRAAIRNDRQARIVGGFLLAAGAATALADLPALSFWGRANQGTGMVLWLGAASAWAAARDLSTEGRRLLRGVLEIGIGINIVVAIIQGWYSGPAPFKLSQSRAHGLTGNPVYLGQLLGLAIPLYLARCAAAVRTQLPGILAALVGVGAAIQLSGSRVTLVILVAGLVWFGRRLQRPRILLATAALALGLIGATFAPRIGDQDTTRRLADSGAGISVRIDIITAALEGTAQRPLLGYGPNQTAQALEGRGSAALARAHSDEIITDAHNLPVEILVTTGLIGLLSAAAVAWQWGRHARGSLAASAVLACATLLTGPLQIVTVPLLAAAAGAATARPDKTARTTRNTRRLSCATVTLALIYGAVLIWADSVQINARDNADIKTLERVDPLTPPWAQESNAQRTVLGFPAATGQGRQYELGALAAAREAVERDPQNPGYWLLLGDYEARYGTLDAAGDAFRYARKIAPYNSSVLRVTIGYETQEGDPGLAVSACEDLNERMAAVVCDPEQVKKAATNRD